MTVLLDRFTEPFRQHLANPDVTDIVVNRPGEIGVECGGVWSWHDEPRLTFNVLMSIAYHAAFESNQDISASEPLCALALPSGERMQVCIPPVVPKDTVSLSIRRPAAFRPKLDALRASSLEAGTAITDSIGVVVSDRLQAAVMTQKNIILAGKTGSGKTTLANALIEDIPLDERLVTIEDTREWVLRHRNWVSLKYSKGDQSAAKGVDAETLIEASLRMRPDRVLMQELRDKAALAYLRGVCAGHPGSITTLHADSAEGAFDALDLMLGDAVTEKQRDLLFKYIHVVVHCERLPNKKYRFTETYL